MSDTSKPIPAMDQDPVTERSNVLRAAAHRVINQVFWAKRSHITTYAPVHSSSRSSAACAPSPPTTNQHPLFPGGPIKAAQFRTFKVPLLSRISLRAYCYSGPVAARRPATMRILVWPISLLYYYLGLSCHPFARRRIKRAAYPLSANHSLSPFHEAV